MGYGAQHLYNALPNSFAMIMFFSEPELVLSPDLGVLPHPAVLHKCISIKHLNHAGVPAGAPALSISACCIVM